jgi:hypothetical protein
MACGIVKHCPRWTDLPSKIAPPFRIGFYYFVALSDPGCCRPVPDRVDPRRNRRSRMDHASRVVARANSPTGVGAAVGDERAVIISMSAPVRR